MRDQVSSATNVTERRLLVSALITTLFVFAEASAGRASHSLALLSDAGHNFSDAVALMFSWYGVWISRRPASKKRTYGYHRVGIMAALFNSASLVTVALLIGWEAAVRIRTPQESHGGVMIVVALIAIVMNGLIAFWLQHEAKHDLNVRSAYVHMLGDALSAFGVVCFTSTFAVLRSPLCGRCSPRLCCGQLGATAAAPSSPLSAPATSTGGATAKGARQAPCVRVHAQSKTRVMRE